MCENISFEGILEKGQSRKKQILKWPPMPLIGTRSEGIEVPVPFPMFQGMVI